MNIKMNQNRDKRVMKDSEIEKNKKKQNKVKNMY